MSDRIRTAVFGGTFDPLHNGHIAIAKSVLEQGLADEVWMLITPCNPWKTDQDLLDDRLRYDMAAEAVKDIKGIIVSDYEFNLPQPSFTANTLRHLSVDYPDREFILTIGADNWAQFSKWKESEFILDHYPIIVYPRKGYQVTGLQYGSVILDCPLVDISSTQIRQMVKDGISIDEKVPASVARTIKELNLYR